MSRNDMEHFDKKSTKTNDPNKKSKKKRAEKGIVWGALFVIIVTLFVMPKYEAYAKSKAMLAEKIRYNQELPDEMSEDQYLEELKIIGEQLDASKKNLPETIDTSSLYEGMAKMAEAAQVSLISVKFDPPDSLIDDALGMRIDKDFADKEEKTIQGADGKFLTACKFTVLCAGNDEQFIALLNHLNQHQPIIRVLNYEIASDEANKKRMILKLESYGIQEEKSDKKSKAVEFINERE